MIHFFVTMDKGVYPEKQTEGVSGFLEEISFVAEALQGLPFAQEETVSPELRWVYFTPVDLSALR